jgi:tRNA pseudouridine55 synthase
MAKPILLENLPVLDNTVTGFPDKEVFASGAVIPVDKPLDWTSFDVVKFIRNRIPARKVGHAGTLDPLATGLLILCCGKATRSISQIQEKPKTYLAEITFGGTTPTYDAASDIIETAPYDHISEEKLQKMAEHSFTGEIQQVPPIYSALRKDGKRMYDLARKGVDVKMESRPVQVYGIELLDFSLPTVKLKIECGKGFYVRSLAYDLGRELGSLGYLSSLRRTDIGNFSAARAWSTDHFNEWSSRG